MGRGVSHYLRTAWLVTSIVHCGEVIVLLLSFGVGTITVSSWQYLCPQNSKTTIGVPLEMEAWLSGFSWPIIHWPLTSDLTWVGLSPVLPVWCGWGCGHAVRCYFPPCVGRTRWTGRSLLPRHTPLLSRILSVATSPTPVNQTHTLQTPYTHTCGQNNHSGRHRLRSQVLITFTTIIWGLTKRE